MLVGKYTIFKTGSLPTVSSFSEKKKRNKTISYCTSLLRDTKRSDPFVTGSMLCRNTQLILELPKHTHTFTLHDIYYKIVLKHEMVRKKKTIFIFQRNV